MMETDVLLRQILYQALVTDDLEDVRRAIKVMCSKDQIAAVMEMVAESKAAKKDN